MQLSDKLIQKVTTQVATYLKTKSDKVEEDMEVFGCVSPLQFLTC